MAYFRSRRAFAFAVGLVAALCATAADDTEIQPGDSRRQVIAIATERVPGEVAEIHWDEDDQLYEIDLVDEQGLEREIYVREGRAYLRSDADFDPRWEAED